MKRGTKLHLISIEHFVLLLILFVKSSYKVGVLGRAVRAVP